jgi:uncharacterized membrane protein
VKRTLAALVVGGMCATAAFAHKGAHEASPSPAPPADAAPTEGPAPDEPAAAAVEAGVDALPAEEHEPSAIDVIPWRTAFTDHLHNKIVHFPLAFGLAAAVLLLVAPRWPAYEPAARLLLLVAAVAAVAAYFSGGAQEEAFDDSPFHAVVELHEAFGIASAITLWTGVALAFWSGGRRILPLYAVFLLAVLSATGFLGGVLSHS